MKKLNKHIAIFLTVPTISGLIIGMAGHRLAKAYDIEELRKRAIAINENGDMLLVDEGKYRIIYLKNDDRWLLRILEGPQESVQLQAQRHFLELLEITQPEACRLEAAVSIDDAVNTQLSNRHLPLSFCSAIGPTGVEGGGSGGSGGGGSGSGGQPGSGGDRQVRSADVHGDGIVNVIDYALVIKSYGAEGTGLAPDIDGDGIVNSVDLSAVLGKLGKKP